MYRFSAVLHCLLFMSLVMLVLPAPAPTQAQKEADEFAAQLNRLKNFVSKDRPRKPVTGVPHDAPTGKQVQQPPSAASLQSEATAGSETASEHTAPQAGGVPQPQAPQQQQAQPRRLGSSNTEIPKKATPQRWRSPVKRTPTPADVLSEETKYLDTAYAEGDLSPVILAEYIHRSGDEEGVVLAVQDLLKQNLITTGEAIDYLQNIKSALARIDEGEVLQNVQNAPVGNTLVDNNLLSIPAGDSMLAIPSNGNVLTIPTDSNIMASLGLPLLQMAENSPIENLDFADRIRLADSYYTESALEEVLYNLAKIVFVHSFTNGEETSAEDVVVKMTSFLKQETTSGRLDPELSKKIMDVMLAALYDTVGDNPNASGSEPAYSAAVVTDSKRQRRKAL
ncbi:unnamed protein product [Cyprideis torosa]|uniref:Uncharacterized protein n=1 Tax=Cyprideis torosa TaxID=163714 RepID=A0A7R8ZNG7_9CRUS|nr:unnamed protein product [Cyprideis torosa]CAG0891545.1 unnamed protein product [Cyprideis torosa]